MHVNDLLLSMFADLMLQIEMLARLGRNSDIAELLNATGDIVGHVQTNSTDAIVQSVRRLRDMEVDVCLSDRDPPIQVIAGVVAHWASSYIDLIDRSAAA
jgi:hypothetical protein